MPHLIHQLDMPDRRLIDRYQRGFPVCERPYAAMADELGLTENELLLRLERLQTLGVLSRVGPVFEHTRLARVCWPPSRCRRTSRRHGQSSSIAPPG
ncbi:hypothetical protein [Halomonas sp. PR-M31]|uniref:hypothetical protein n=1 Tax=Halomonas sp. PR-M31 TaxID=1471202 RepID=UPI0020A1532A|nr:hypothetical protein [Halomonas sp. PR-M31]